jgi:hypothetical protein
LSELKPTSGSPRARLRRTYQRNETAAREGPTQGRPSKKARGQAAAKTSKGNEKRQPATSESNSARAFSVTAPIPLSGVLAPLFPVTFDASNIKDDGKAPDAAAENAHESKAPLPVGEGTTPDGRPLQEWPPHLQNDPSARYNKIKLEYKNKFKALKPRGLEIATNTTLPYSTDLIAKDFVKNRINKVTGILPPNEGGASKEIPLSELPLILDGLNHRDQWDAERAKILRNILGRTPTGNELLEAVGDVPIRFFNDAPKKAPHPNEILILAQPNPDKENYGVALRRSIPLARQIAVLGGRLAIMKIGHGGDRDDAEVDASMMNLKILDELSALGYPLEKTEDQIALEGFRQDLRKEHRSEHPDPQELDAFIEDKLREEFFWHLIKRQPNAPDKK